MRTADPNAIALLQGADTRGLVTAAMLVFEVKTFAGDPVPFGFWTEHDTETGTVVSPWTGTPASYPFVGGGAVLDVGEVPRTSDLDVVDMAVTLSAVHETVLDMWTGHDMRLAKIAVYEGLFDPQTRNFVSAMLEFVGEVDGAPKNVPAAGGEGGIQFTFVSDTQQLTRTNPAKRSDAHQRTRNGDGFHKYIGVAGDWINPWGQNAEGGDRQGIFSGSKK
ncbi:hypothetical protein [Pelagibacterium lentulum]|uniref:Uncharacterized protein n=1 Tax=Pelagibacterium lentulum TaxID=2029865 RepID=A0A916W4E1_9HYPH|nr:hypothetical protein [Pelagibacterium lentulum]GGA65008.1 hypothetical protein GCM10011499_39330 [Pelagibacterium lentulum]